MMSRDFSDRIIGDNRKAGPADPNPPRDARRGSGLALEPLHRLLPVAEARARVLDEARAADGGEEHARRPCGRASRSAGGTGRAGSPGSRPCRSTLRDDRCRRRRRSLPSSQVTHLVRRPASGNPARRFGTIRPRWAVRIALVTPRWRGMWAPGVRIEKKALLSPGMLGHRRGRLRAAGAILLIVVAIAEEEEALPLVRRRDPAMVGRDVGERRDALLRGSAAGRPPRGSRANAPRGRRSTGTMRIEHRIVADLRRARDHAADPVAQPLAEPEQRRQRRDLALRLPAGAGAGFDISFIAAN